MLKIENTEVFGIQAAIRGMRNPLNSWTRSDSGICKGGDNGIGCDKCADRNMCGHSFDHQFKLGKNDEELMLRLAKGGPVHAKYRRMIDVYVDITAPLYWWKEFKTYRTGVKFGDDEPDIFVIPDDYFAFDIEMNSCSTMHKIQEKEFTLDDFSHEHLLCLGGNCDFSKLPTYGDELWDADLVLKIVVKSLNFYRDAFLESNNKDYWWQMIQLLPTSYNQKRTVKMNYEVLAAQREQRKGHKLDEWHTYCDWIDSLPYSQLLK